MSTDEQRIAAAENPDVETPQDSVIRYAAYSNRLRTILLASHRYVAYTSDIGESFRPLAHPYLVKFGYGISWAYILGDVLYASWIAKSKAEGRFTPGLKPWDPQPEASAVAASEYKEKHGAKLSEYDWRVVGLKRGLFQSIASMALPAFTIHSTVRYSSYLFKNASAPVLRTYGPVALGLAVVPLLPYIFDEPCEKIIDYVFDKGDEYFAKKKID